MHFSCDGALSTQGMGFITGGTRWALALHLGQGLPTHFLAACDRELLAWTLSSSFESCTSNDTNIGHLMSTYYVHLPFGPTALSGY